MTGQSARDGRVRAKPRLGMAMRRALLLSVAVMSQSLACSRQPMLAEWPVAPGVHLPREELEKLAELMIPMTAFFSYLVQNGELSSTAPDDVRSYDCMMVPAPDYPVRADCSAELRGADVTHVYRIESPSEDGGWSVIAAWEEIDGVRTHDLPLPSAEAQAQANARGMESVHDVEWTDAPNAP